MTVNPIYIWVNMTHHECGFMTVALYGHHSDYRNLKMNQ
jgi:hypothetical protein